MFIIWRIRKLIFLFIPRIKIYSYKYYIFFNSYEMWNEINDIITVIVNSKTFT